MAFTVYPDAATAALLGSPANQPVDSAKMTTFVPVAAFNGNPFGTTLFIRISVSLPAVAPTVSLRAGNPAAGTTGTPKVITATSSPGMGLSDGSSNTTDAAAAWLEGAPANNVQLVKVFIAIDGTAIEIQITSAGHNFVWVVADSDADSHQPWIQLTPFVPFNVLVKQGAALTAQALQIGNRGTGALTIATITPALASPYTLNPTGLPNSGLPATLPPNPAAPANVLIGFDAPATTGSTPATNYAVDGDPGAVPGPANQHNNAFSLSATTSQVEVVMVLDDSGSMAGNDTTSGDTRLGELKSAAKQFLNYLAAFGAKGGTVGVVRFPGSNPADMTTYDLLLAEEIPEQMTTELQAIDSMTAIDSTPMDLGIQEVFSRTAPRYFANDDLSIANNRRWMLLMSDGAWNVGADPHGEIATLQQKKVVVFSAGYGKSGQVDYVTLNDLATASGGQALQVDIGAGLSAKALAQKFKSVIASNLTDTAADPDGVILPGEEVRHEILITPHDRKAVFSVNWDTPNDGLELQLLTPTCDLITAQTAAETAGISFNRDVRYRMFVIDESYLRNDADPTQPRHGTWRMVVSYPSVIIEVRDAAVVPGEHYSYDVLTESSLKLDVTLDRRDYYAGDPIEVSARVTLHGVPITGASVRLSLTAPGQSMDNWLAAQSISAAEYQNAAGQLAGKDASGVYVKAFAAQLKGLVFDGAPATTGLVMTETNQSGVYSATVNQTTIPDGHTLYVTATGTTADGVAFRRERSVSVHVSVRPDPRFTLFNITYGAQANPAVIRGLVSITPRDRFGNVVLIDPASSQHIQLQATGAALDPKLATGFDGTYTSGISYPAGSSPTLTLVIGGQPVFTGKGITPVDQLIWVDQVVEFKAGMEGAPGANQHTNPDDALGNLLTKPADTFVALGGYGSLTVGVHGQIILAHGADDVTVFVQPDVSPRPYLVEVLKGIESDHHGLLHLLHKPHHSDPKEWVVLGRSSGATASFSLLDAKLSGTSAIRITDESGCTRDAAFKPLDGPGARVRAVGVTRTAKQGTDAGISLQVRVLSPSRQPLGGTVDLELKPHESGEIRIIKSADASKDINVSGLQRTPAGIYQVTVTPTDVFKPVSQFVTIPASDFETVEFIVDKGA